jgi:N-acetylglucosamine kinase-like BadF-type ATPase
VRYVLGIDAGGTKTVGLLADDQGRVVASARDSGANLQTHGELEVEKVFHRIVEQLLPDGDPRAVAALCLGIAGVDRPGDETVIRSILRRLGHRDPARGDNDAAIALVAGAPAGVGIVVLAGTGSIAYGVDASGRTARAGGYGFVLADEGSSYWFGHQALRAAIRAAEGRGPATALQTLLFEHLAVSSAGELVPLVYVRGLPKDRIAALAPLVQRAADAGDQAADELLALGARELALAARSVHARLSFGDERFPLVLAGGAFKACPSLLPRLSAALDLPGAEPRLLDREPAHGAVTLALQLLAPTPPAPGAEAPP